MAALAPACPLFLRRTMTAESPAGPPGVREILNKVPEITLFFWVIKILCTTVGETAADFLNTNLKLGLTGTTLVMGVLLAAVLVVQFRLRQSLF